EIASEAAGDFIHRLLLFQREVHGYIFRQVNQIADMDEIELFELALTFQAVHETHFIAVGSVIFEFILLIFQQFFGLGDLILDTAVFLFRFSRDECAFCKFTDSPDEYLMCPFGGCFGHFFYLICIFWWQDEKVDQCTGSQTDRSRCQPRKEIVEIRISDRRDHGHGCESGDKDTGMEFQSISDKNGQCCGQRIRQCALSEQIEGSDRDKSSNDRGRKSHVCFLQGSVGSRFYGDDCSDYCKNGRQVQHNAYHCCEEGGNACFYDSWSNDFTDIKSHIITSFSKI